MRYSRIPDETVRRLPIYLRGLLLLSEQGQRRISSRELGDLLGVNSWQIRKDLFYFGGFGTPGVGYDIRELVEQINKILKLNVGQKAVLVGVGNLGRAILTYPGFEIYGFDISAAFDIDPKKIGKKVGNVTIKSISKLKALKRRKIKLGIIAVPRDAAQEIADKLVDVGIKGILNFSTCRLSIPNRVKVITIDIAMDLARLPYYV
jgi:redox-sensing transcriptional repressor